MRIHFGVGWLWLILLLALLAKSMHCQVADAARPPVPSPPGGPDAPSTSLAASVAQPWARGNRWWIGGFLALQGADAMATQRDQSARYHMERNPLMPRTTAGRAAYFAGTVGLVLGASWLAERRGHRRLARWILRGACVVEAQANVMSWGRL